MERTKIELIKTEFESKLLFDNPLINDIANQGEAHGFSENIDGLYEDLPKDKSFVRDIEFEDAVLFWVHEGALYHSKSSHFMKGLKADVLEDMASGIFRNGEAHYFLDYLLNGKKYDILILKEEHGVFGMLKESLSHGVLVQLANLTSRVQELERRRLSLDLHDSVIQHLSGIKFLLSALKNEDSIVVKCKKAIDVAINETRMVSRNLMPLKFEKKGLDLVLNEFIESLEQYYTVQIEISNTSDFKTLKSSFQLAVYRIVQELCSNSIKHGKSSKINISFRTDNENFDFHYSDNGKGFDIDNYNSSRMGISNIYYRVFQFGGELDIKSVKKMGVNYYFAFPLPKIYKI